MKTLAKHFGLAVGL